MHDASKLYLYLGPYCKAQSQSHLALLKVQCSNSLGLNKTAFTDMGPSFICVVWALFVGVQVNFMS